jgi:hypothetical protein
MSASIALYFMTTRLHEAGWPRRCGLLRRYRFDATVVDATVDEMIDWAAAMGAGRPMLAAQLAAHIMDDCAMHGEDGPTLEALVEQARAEPDEAIAPHERLQPVRFANTVGAMIPQSTFSKLDVRVALQQWCLEALRGVW